MSCPYYTFRQGDYYCSKKGDYVNSDCYYKYCRNYDYSDCPIYKGESSSSCFLTSACVEAKDLPDDCYELQTLRKFRDDWLRKREKGVDLIIEYYDTAPKIVRAIDKLANSQQVYEAIYTDMIIPCIKLIENQHMEEALELYMSETLKYKSIYLSKKDE